MKRQLILSFVFSTYMSQALANDEATPEAPAPAVAAESQESTCKTDKLVRRVILDNSSEACTVKYIKDTEQPGVEHKLWTYAHERDTCKTKYSEFVEKLKGMGYNCGT